LNSTPKESLPPWPSSPPSQDLSSSMIAEDSGFATPHGSPMLTRCGASQEAHRPRIKPLTTHRAPLSPKCLSALVIQRQ
jgi:hypothetical protein